MGQTLVSLSGKWQLELDPNGTKSIASINGRVLSDEIDLPTTTDEAQKGPLQVSTGETWKLTRTHPFTGVAWYRRSFSVPDTSKGERQWLFLERTKSTIVYLDGMDKGHSKNLSTPQIFDLDSMSPGAHTICLRVDNRLHNWPDRVTASHMLEESTQTNWNGVTGRIEIRSEGASTIEGITAAPTDNSHELELTADLLGKQTGLFKVRAFEGSHQVAEANATGPKAILNFGPHAKLWDEFAPNLYRIEASFKNSTGIAYWHGEVGLRKFEAKNASFLINGRRTFLRGKHDGCVFPLTGHPPMDTSGWERYFSTSKSYGINHIRFHSWCPPEAAFVVADRMGFYLQPELPFWGDPSKPGVESYLVSEGKRILRTYGNHPSLVMLSLGNEFWGDPGPRSRMVAALRLFDPSRLYDQGSNSESWNAHEFQGDDYRVSAYAHTTDEGAARGSYAHSDNRVGYIIAGTSGTLHTYSQALTGTRQPFISHEVGQYDTFPNFQESSKYHGVLRADNLIEFQKRLTRAGMLDQDPEFVQASGRLSAQLYREEIEAALRTPEMDGFDLLDLQDYPGQGTSLVGTLDAFMDSKGLISPKNWREFCGPVVPLALFSKYTWSSDEVFSAKVRVANYSPSDIQQTVAWEISEGSRRVAGGMLGEKVIPSGGVEELGEIATPLLGVSAPVKLKLTLAVQGRKLDWPVWVYPKASVSNPRNVSLSSKVDDVTLAQLDHGERVILIPKTADLTGSVPGDFATDFWNYPMFKGGNPPGTLGFLIQNKHPALAEFPSDLYSEWQWQSLAHHSRAVILDAFPGFKPIVQTIDNFERNHRLGTIFEVKVGNGSLLVCTIDLPSMKDVPEARQLMRSLVDYVASPKFHPSYVIGRSALTQALYGK